MTITDLIPAALKDGINAVLDKTRDLLQGETLRLILYGGAAFAYVICRLTKALPDLSFADTMAQVTVASTILIAMVESARHFVYSPKTVAAIVLTPPTASGPIGAAVEAGAGDAIQSELDRG